MRTWLKVLVVITAALAMIGGGAAAAWGASLTGDDDVPLTGTVRERATAAALAATGGGSVTDTEAGDDGARYEVEVERPDGTQVEVELDDAFTVTGTEADDD